MVHQQQAGATDGRAHCTYHHSDWRSKAGPRVQVYLASASPPVRYPNVYGVDMPVRSEFVASDKTEDEICKELGADRLIYQSLQDLVAVGHDLNPEITEFDTSCFTGAPCSASR